MEEPTVKKQRFDGDEATEETVVDDETKAKEAKREEDEKERLIEETVAKLTVRMKGIPFEGVTESDIAAFFEDCDIEDEGIFIAPLTRVAYAQFKDEESVVKALAKGGSFQGRCISITQAKPFHRTKDIGVAAAAEHFSEAPFSTDSFVIQVRFLPYWTTEDRVMEFYKDFEVLAIHMVWDHVGRSTSSAFIEFTKEEDQKKALETVTKIDEKGRVSSYEHSKLAEMLPLLHPTLAVSAIWIKAVRVPNLATEDDIRKFFQGLDVTGVVFSKNYAGRNTGTVFVSVASYEDGFKLLAKTGATIGLANEKAVTRVHATVGLYPSSQYEVTTTLASHFLGCFGGSVRLRRQGRGGMAGRGRERGRGRGRGRRQVGRRVGRGGYRGKKRDRDELDQNASDGQPPAVVATVIPPAEE